MNLPNSIPHSINCPSCIPSGLNWKEQLAELEWQMDTSGYFYLSYYCKKTVQMVGQQQNQMNFL